MTKDKDMRSALPTWFWIYAIILICMVFYLREKNEEEMQQIYHDFKLEHCRGMSNEECSKLFTLIYEDHPE